MVSEKLIEKAIATPEQIEEAKRDGEPFRFEDRVEKIALVGYKLNGVVYITDIVNI